MDTTLMKILLILIGATLIGGFTGLFNILYGTIFVSFLVAYIIITFFWKDLLIEIAKFLLSFLIPRRWRH